MRLKIPPGVQVLFFGGAMWVISKYTEIVSLDFKGINEFALFFLSGGVLMIGFGIAEFRKSKTTITPLHPDQASRFVTSGIYRFTRNPMYFGMLLILFSIWLYLQNLANSIVLPLYVWFIRKYQIIPEEEALHKLFGEEYQHYQDKVRRWI